VSNFALRFVRAILPPVEYSKGLEFVRTQNMLKSQPWKYYATVEEKWLNISIIKHVDFFTAGKFV
jgi:hypothetical protein